MSFNLTEAAMTSNESLLCGYYFPTKKGVKSENIDKLKSLSSTHPYWLHFHIDHEDSKQWLMHKSKLSPLVVNALLADETRPRVSIVENGVLIILRGVNLNENAEPEDMISIRIFTDGKRVITTRRRKLKAVQDLQTSLESDNGPRNAGDLVTMLISLLCQRMSPTIELLNDKVDELEEIFLTQPNKLVRYHILDTRREAIILKRYLSPMRQALIELKQHAFNWLSINNQHHIQEACDHMTRFVEDLDSNRERLQVTYDELRNIISDKLNNTMYIISVFTAIFLPLGFLTGLFGVNLGGIPGAESQDSFLLFSCILGGLLFFQAVLFRFLRWF